MFEQKKEKAFWLRVRISAIMLAVIVIWTGCKRQPAEQPQAEHPGSEATQSEPVTQTTGESAKIDIKPSASPKVSLSDIIKAARTWGPAYTTWYGKPAPDFALTDLDGKEHKLSDYKDKKVLLVFWATWCPPCLREIPDLIELRETVSEDNLAMLAISNENPDLVKSFVTQANIGAFHLNLWVHALIELWAWNKAASVICDRSSSPWDDFNRRPSHADRRRSLRREVLKKTFFETFGHDRKSRKIARQFYNLMKLAA